MDGKNGGNALSANQGDKVRLHYRGTLADGTVFESSFDSRPLEFIIGQQMVIPAFEEAVIGMQEGQSKTFTLAAAQAYGEYRSDRVIEINRSEIGPHVVVKADAVVPLRLPGGLVSEVRIVRITPDTITVDANHPLAGKQLTFEIKLLHIVKPAERGRPGESC